MSLISAGSISLDSTFNWMSTEVFFAEKKVYQNALCFHEGLEVGVSDPDKLSASNPLISES
jgi:hypothetical protein